jgi:hypothetical protein
MGWVPATFTSVTIGAGSVGGSAGGSDTGGTGGNGCALVFW